MAEEKDGLPEGGTPAEPTPAEPTPPESGTPEPKPVDWEQRYKALQTDHTQTKQRLASLEAQATQPPEELPEEYGDDETFVDRKTVGQMIKQAVSEERQTSADSYFRRTYPEFIDDEGAISGILRSPKHRAELLKCASSEDRVDFAVNKFKERLDKASVDAKAEAEAEAKEREEKNRKATGLGGTSTTPSKSDDEGKSDADEIRDRKARQAKQRNLA